MPSVSRRVTASPEVVWALLVDLDAWPSWGPSVAAASLDDDRLRLGSRGTVRTAVGLSLRFEVTEFEEGRRWAWWVAGVPATGHRVDPRPDGCEVTFDVPRWAPAYLAVCWLALRRIDRLTSAG